MSRLGDEVDKDLLESIGRVNDREFLPESITFSTVRDSTAGKNTLVTGTAVEGKGYSGTATFNYDRIDIGAGPDIYCNNIPAQAAKRISELLPAINKSTKFNLRKEDIVDRDLTITGAPGDTFILSCSERSGRYRGSMSIVMSSTTDYFVVGKMQLTMNRKYRIIPGADQTALPSADYSTLIIGGKQYPLDRAGYFVFDQPTGEYPFTFAAPSIERFGQALPITELTRIRCDAPHLDLRRFLYNNASVRLIGDNIFAGNRCTVAFESFASNCGSLVSVGENFFSNNLGITSMNDMFQNCRSLENIGESLPTNAPNTVKDISNVLESCVKLKAVPAGMFANMQSVEKAAYAFRAVGSQSGEGCFIPADVFHTMTAVVTADYMFNSTKLQNWLNIDLTQMRSVETANMCFAGSNINNTERAAFVAAKRLRDLSGAYRDCRGPISVPGRLLSPDARAACGALFTNAVISDISIQAFPKDTVNNATAMFQGAKLPNSIPNLMSEQSMVDSLQSFFREADVTLTAANSNFFGGCARVTSIQEMFRKTSFRGGVIPAKLFDPLVNVTNASTVFAECRGVGETVVVPMGIFAKQNKVKEFISCFYNSSNIAFEGWVLPENKSATDLTRFASQCGATSYPDDFLENADNVTSANDLFSYCQAKTLPVNLLSSLGKVTSMRTAFASSAGPLQFPKGFFDPLVSLVNFSDAFRSYASGLTLPENAFSKLTNLTTISNLFRYGKKVTVTGSLFYNNLKITNASSLFEACELEGDLTNLFAPAHKANNVNCDRMFGNALLTNSNFGKVATNLPINGSANYMFSESKHDEFFDVIDSFVALNGVGPDNHLTTSNLTDMWYNAKWLIGSRDEAIKALWNTDDPSKVPNSAITNSGINTTGLV